MVARRYSRHRSLAPPGGDEHPALERARTGQDEAGQRALRHQGDEDEPGAEQDARAGQHPPEDRIGGRQRQILGGLISEGLVKSAALVAGAAGQQARGTFGEPGQRAATGQLGVQHRPALLAVSRAATARAPEQHRVTQQPGDRAEVSPGLRAAVW